MRNEENNDAEVIVKYEDNKVHSYELLSYYYQIQLENEIVNKLKSNGKVKITGMSTMINFVVQMAENIKQLYIQVFKSHVCSYAC